MKAIASILDSTYGILILIAGLYFKYLRPNDEIIIKKGEFISRPNSKT